MTAQITERIVICGAELGFGGLDLPLGYVLAERKITLQPWHSANWRGYCGHWALREDFLWLDQIEGAHDLQGMPITLGDVFPNRDPPILAEWFSGNLLVRSGRLLRYAHVGFASRFEFERTLTFASGRLTADATKRNTLEELEAAARARRTKLRSLFDD